MLFYYDWLLFTRGEKHLDDAGIKPSCPRFESWLRIVDERRQILLIQICFVLVHSEEMLNLKK